MQYKVHKVPEAPALDSPMDGPIWRDAPALTIDNFRAEGSDHRPKTQAKVVYTRESLFVLFSVQDQYVRSIHKNYMDPVYMDSCVEFFVQPKPDKGYFNFEINAGGTLFVTYVTDHRRLPNGDFAERARVDKNQVKGVIIYHSMPEVIEPEIQEPTEWRLAYAVPFALFEPQVGLLGEIDGQEWRANFYKCGDGTSHPHWGSWAPITAERPNFHLPEFFGTIRFEA